MIKQQKHARRFKLGITFAIIAILAAVAIMMPLLHNANIAHASTDTAATTLKLVECLNIEGLYEPALDPLILPWWQTWVFWISLVAAHIIVGAITLTIILLYKNFKNKKQRQV